MCRLTLIVYINFLNSLPTEKMEIERKERCHNLISKLEIWSEFNNKDINNDDIIIIENANWNMKSRIKFIKNLAWFKDITGLKDTHVSSRLFL